MLTSPPVSSPGEEKAHLPWRHQEATRTWPFCTSRVPLPDGWRPEIWGPMTALSGGCGQGNLLLFHGYGWEAAEKPPVRLNQTHLPQEMAVESLSPHFLFKWRPQCTPSSCHKCNLGSVSPQSHVWFHGRCAKLEKMAAQAPASMVGASTPDPAQQLQWRVP